MNFIEKSTRILGIVLPFFIMSCGGGLKPVELMYAGKNTTMYYISPFTMESDRYGKAEVDFTFRHHLHKDSSRQVSCKFTFYSEEPGIEKVSKVFFTMEGDTTEITLKQLDRFYVERGENRARYEGKMMYDDLKKLFTANSCTLTVVIPKHELVYGPKGSVQKTRIAVRREMIDLIDE